MFQRLHHSKLAAYTALTTPSKGKLEQSSCSTAARQMRLNQCGLRASSVSQATVDRLVVDFVTEALLPFSVVGLPSFKRLVTGLQPNRTVLCRKTAKARMADMVLALKTRLVETLRSSTAWRRQRTACRPGTASTWG